MFMRKAHSVSRFHAPGRPRPRPRAAHRGHCRTGRNLGLALCTLVAVTVVSVGIARADVVGNVIDNESGLFAIALLLGLLFIGMGGLTILSLPHHAPAQKDPQLTPTLSELPAMSHS